METWKLLTAISVVLVVFGVIVAALDVELSGPLIVGLLIGAAVFAAIQYVLGKYGYRIGRRIGESVQDDESE